MASGLVAADADIAGRNMVEAGELASPIEFCRIGKARTQLACCHWAVVLFLLRPCSTAEHWSLVARLTLIWDLVIESTPIRVVAGTIH